MNNNNNNNKPLCRKCNITLNEYKPSDGRYFLCPQCNSISYPINNE